jgi:SAM-dependent methyltransferase
MKSSYERVADLEKRARRSQWFRRCRVAGNSMYAPLQVFEELPGGHKGIVDEQLQATRERLGKKENEPLVVGDLGCAYGVMVAQLNQMQGVEAFGIDRLLYPPVTEDENYDGPRIYIMCEGGDIMTEGGAPLFDASRLFGLTPEMFRRDRHIVADITYMREWFIGVPANSFDFLVSAAMLIHLDEFSLLEAIMEIDRVLVPKGGALLHVSGSALGRQGQKELLGRISCLGKRNAEAVGSDKEELAEILHFEYLD